nr:LysR substrate-binding domain-containing protein [Phyllobacterium phragmitis]
MQLVLSDVIGAETPKLGIVGTRLWRFVDLERRLDFLLAGFGWCKMPPHVVAPYLADGRLVKLDIADESIAPSANLTVYAAHSRGHPFGKAGNWLLENVRNRLAMSMGMLS